MVVLAVIIVMNVYYQGIIKYYQGKLLLTHLYQPSSHYYTH